MFGGKWDNPDRTSPDEAPSNFDLLLNISGITTLVVGFILLVWDWAWFVLGGEDQYTLGISHLVIDLHGILIGEMACKRQSGVTKRLSSLLHLLVFLDDVHLGALFILPLQ
jgi:hypothetical protein